MIISEKTLIPINEEGGPIIVKVVPFPSIIKPASVFNHRKNFSVHVNAWGVKNGEGINLLSHSNS